MFKRTLRWQKPFSIALPVRRQLHLAPPFMLDSYTPRYQSISSVDASRKRSLAYAHLRNCNLCPRLCSVNRYEKTGHCMIGAETVKVNVIGPHFGEVRMIAYVGRRNVGLPSIIGAMYTRAQWQRQRVLLRLQSSLCLLSESRYRAPN